MKSLIKSIKFLAKIQRYPINLEELKQIVSDHYKEINTPLKNLIIVSKQLLVVPPKKIHNIEDPSRLPLIVFYKNEWGVIKNINAKGEYIIQFEEEQSFTEIPGAQIFALKLTQEFYLGKSKTFNLVKNEILKHKKILIDGLVAGVFINIVAIFSAF